MIRKYELKAYGYINIITDLEVKVHNSNIKLKNYKTKREQFEQNKMFRINASQFYKELNGSRHRREYIIKSRRSYKMLE